MPCAPSRLSVMTQRGRAAEAGRLAVLVALLAAIWLIAPPAGVPLYDGVGFPDEPYRSVPAQGDTPPATSAEARIALKRGVNPGGQVANSAEQGPQISVFAPPQAFQVATTADSLLVVRAEPVIPVKPPPGRLQSNVYRLTLTSPAGPVTVNPKAQPIGMALRAVAVAEAALPVMHFRPDPESPWRALKTKRVGEDAFAGSGPAAGDYVLAPPPQPVGKQTSTTLLLVLVVGALVFVGAVLVAVRRLNTARATA